MTKYNTKLGEYCATHENWEVELASEPYNLKIKFGYGFVIFNYNQLSSDFNNEIVREARGIIFRKGEWEHPVCHAFDKFGNYGEGYVPDMDWESVKCSEKIDGSIMKLWCYNGCWNLSTNGNIDAKESPIGDVRKEDFAQIFWEGVVQHIPNSDGKGKLPSLIDWFNTLNPEYTYIFELVSPYTRVVIPYKNTEVYFLGARNNISNQQFGCDTYSAMYLNVDFLPRPKLYPMRSIKDITEAANALPWDSEGYVCYDKNFNRCKIKSPKYVMAHFARNNNVITRWHLIDIILKGEMEEFKIYASDYADQIEYVKKLMDDFVQFMDACALMTRNLRKLSRPEAAEVIKKFHKLVQNIMFMNLETLVGGKEYTKDWDTYKWERALENYTQFLVRGPENDL
jgi:hypothetical protein